MNKYLLLKTEKSSPVLRLQEALPCDSFCSGWVAERFKAAVLKTAVRGSVPWVRIPLHPPYMAGCT